MAKSPKAPSRTIYKKKLRFIFVFTGIALVLKVLWLWGLLGHGLLGADGENYLAGVDALDKEGLFSKASFLHYWPAGYPIFMWPLREIFGAFDVFIVGLMQSIIFAIAIVFFSSELLKRKLVNLTVPLAVFLNLSPTLSLNSVVIGYEVPTASLLLISTTFLMRYLRNHKKTELLYASFSMSIASFMQPRIILLAFGILFVFAIYSFKTRFAAGFLVLSLLIVSIAPGLLAIRNLQANDFLAVSTNLGVTMNIGAGDQATGGYSNDAKGVPCELVNTLNPAQKDSGLVRCVLTWYIENPSKATALFFKKFVYHWSPWFGPLSNGTTARNPWLNFNPLVNIARNSEGGSAMIFGSIGKVISWLWFILGFALMFLGFRALIRRGGDSAILAWILMVPVALNSATSMGTIGDNRFRIPTLTLSVLLQGFGLLSIFQKREFREGLDGAQPPRVALNWKSRSESDNLPT